MVGRNSSIRMVCNRELLASFHSYEGITKYDLRDSRLSCLVNLFQVKGAVSEETADDWFEDKLSNALKDIEQTSEK